MDAKPIFTIDLEDWNHGLHITKGEHTSTPAYLFILDLLDKYKVKAIIYILGKYFYEDRTIWDVAHKRGHVIGSHGEHHDWGEQNKWKESISGPYRSPYFSLEGLPFPPAGGFFFRAMPLAYVKWAIKRSGVFWIHPHDLDIDHPRLRNPWLHWKRHVGLKQSRLKLLRLLSEVEFGNPSKTNYLKV